MYRDKSPGASASCRRRGVCPRTPRIPTPEPGCAGDASLLCPAPGVQLLRSVSVRGRSVTSAVSFFPFNHHHYYYLHYYYLHYYYEYCLTSFNSKRINWSTVYRAVRRWLVWHALLSPPPPARARSLTHLFSHSSTAGIGGVVAPNTLWLKLVGFQ